MPTQLRPFGDPPHHRTSNLFFVFECALPHMLIHAIINQRRLLMILRQIYMFCLDDYAPDRLGPTHPPPLVHDMPTSLRWVHRNPCLNSA